MVKGRKERRNKYKEGKVESIRVKEGAKGEGRKGRKGKTEGIGYRLMWASTRITCYDYYYATPALPFPKHHVLLNGQTAQHSLGYTRARISYIYCSLA